MSSTQRVANVRLVKNDFSASNKEAPGESGFYEEVNCLDNIKENYFGMTFCFKRGDNISNSIHLHSTLHRVECLLLKPNWVYLGLY